MADEAMIAGRAYWLKLGTQTASATVAAPKYQVNVNTMEQMAAKTLELNAIGVAEIATDKPIVFEAYTDNRALGGFILIDKIEESAACRLVVHGSIGIGQIHHSQPGGEKTPPHEPPYLSARRRQCAPRAEQGSGLH
jgi:bifunctional enzyme CysN/CysC